MDSAQLLAFLSRPRTMREVAKRFGLAIEQVEQLLREPLESGKVVVSMEKGKHSLVTLTESGQSISPLQKLPDAGRGRSLPTVRSPINSKNGLSGKYHGLHFKFKEAVPSVVKRAEAPVVFAEIFEAKESERAAFPSRLSLSLEARLLDSLSFGPKTITDLRLSRGVSQRTMRSLERKGLVETFWGLKGGRAFRITRKGSTELRRLKSAASVNRRTAEKPLISARRISAPLPV